ncbi:MAG: hypothetical protein CMG64_07735 [Candidatus Marinimicrobia bacterium]|nr:hypothetical protein [Candidatus Neomarinimicrobiota bacterium]
MNSNINNLPDSKTEVDLMNLVHHIKRNLLYIALFVFLSMIVWFFYVVNAEKIYESKSVIQVTGQGTSSLPSYESSMLGSQNLNADEQIELYLSRTILKQVTNKLQLNIFVNDKSLNSTPSPDLGINYFFVNLNKNDISKVYYLKRVEDSYELYDEDKELIHSNISFNSEFKKNEINLNLAFLNSSSEGELIKLTYISLPKTLKDLRKSFFLKKVIEQRSFIPPSVLEISFKGPSEYLNNLVIDTTNKSFLDLGVSYNASEAKKSISFINDRLKEIRDQLTKNEEVLKKFKQENITNNLQFESESLFTELISLENKLKEVELEEAEMMNLYNSTNPLLESLITQKNVLNNQIDEVNLIISKLPETQQEYINLSREVTLAQEIYEELMSARLDFSIKEASTAGNIRIIDKAYSEGQISPKYINSFIAFFILSFGLGIVASIFRGLYFAPIGLPSEVIRNFPQSSFIGIIPSREENEDDVKKTSRYQEALNSLVTNLTFGLEQNRDTQSSGSLILVTGALKSTGKTFISRELSLSLASIGKSTLIIDCDFKQGDIHEDFSIDKSNINSFSIEGFNKESILVRENLYILPRPSGYADNSLTLFSSPSFAEFLAYLRGQFDFIVLDTPPALAVSDGLLLANHADTVLAVLRHEHTKLKEHEQMVKDFSLLDIQLNNLVYNDFKRPTGYYGYDYYAYKYYGYNYTYENKD